MATNIPIWLLDFDGVLNVIAANAQENIWPLESWSFNTVIGGTRPWPVLTARPVLDFIRRVHAQKLAEIRWHSTWRGYIRNAETTLDLPEFPITEAPEFEDKKHRGWWKIPTAARVVLVENRRLLWTDDDLTPYNINSSSHLWQLDKKSLLITPKTHHGLTPKNLEHIEEFLNA